MQNTNPAGSGGFLPPSLPSPSPSTTSSQRNSSTNTLPHPRSHPLVAGSKKEDAARRYVENKLLQISRRFVKKFSVLPGEEDASEKLEVKGYANFAEVAKDLNEIVDVLWLSGTRKLPIVTWNAVNRCTDIFIKASLQIPYLLQMAVTFTSYIQAFPPSPTAAFALLDKLDHAFSSLIVGRDSTSGDLLPGFEDGAAAGFSRTELIRLRSVVVDARIRVAEVLTGAEDDATEVETDVETENESESMELDVDGDDDMGGVEMGIARTYEATIVQLNLVLGGDVFDAGTD